MLAPPVQSGRSLAKKKLYIESKYNNVGKNHGTYIRWQLKKWCARKEQTLVFYLFKAFD